MNKSIYFLLTLILLSMFSVQPIEAKSWLDIFGGDRGKEGVEEVRGEKKGKEEGKDEIKPTKAPEIKEIRIENRLKNLKPVYKEGKIASISGTLFVLTVGKKTFNVETNEKTIYLRKSGDKSSFGELKVGDKLNVRGTWTNEPKSSILATSIRNNSILKKKAVFWGKIISITGSDFVLKTVERGDLTVKTSVGTKIVNRKEGTLAFLDLKVDHRVRVSGIWDSVLKTLEEVTLIKNWSLPPFVTPTPKVSPTVTPTPTP